MASLRDSVTEKILAVKVSPMFMAILDCLLDVEPRRTDPGLVSLVITSDGGLLGQQADHVGYNDFLGSKSDLYYNIDGISEVAELTNEEYDWLQERVEALCR